MEKRLVALGMTLLMLLVSLLSGAAADVITSLPADSIYVQDLLHYAQAGLTFENADTRNDGRWVRKFSGNRDTGEEIIAAYVAALTSGGWNFEVNHVHDVSYHGGKEKYYSVSLTYTGTADFPRGTIEQLFDDQYTGDVMIYYSRKNNMIRGDLTVAKGLEAMDLGLRLDGQNVSVEQPGKSSSAELVENADGSFSTSDGRLTAAPGQAMILRDGVPYTTEEVSIDRNRDSGKEKILIQRYYRNEGIAMAFPFGLLMTGDTFGMREMGQVDVRDNNVNSVEGFFNRNIIHNNNYLFGVCHSGDYVWAHPDPTQCLQKLLIRVLLWDESRQLCVFYIAAEFDSEPYELEALAAIRMSDVTAYNEDAERITMYVGETRTLSFDDRAYMPTVEFYQWELLEGSSCVERSGVRSRECRVSAVWKGRVRIRATYTYRVTEPDMLTGINGTVEKSKVKEYIIDIE